VSDNSPIPPLVGIIMGSLSDNPVLKPGLDLLEDWGVPYEVLVASAHRTPERVAAWASSARERGLQVIIAAAGGAAHLPGVVAAHTTLPVIGLPIDTGSVRGVDALYSIVQMPPGIPVATVGINNSVNAAALALHMLALLDVEWEEVLDAYRSKMSDKIDKQNEQLREERPDAVWAGEVLSVTKQDLEEEEAEGDEERIEVRDINLDRPLDPAPGATAITLEGGRARPSHFPKRKAEYIGLVDIEEDLMPIELVERAVDCLLDGGIVALPTDTVYGVAVDATNKEAVARLYELKARDADRPISVFIDSQRLLAQLVCNLTVVVRRMLDAFWPGPLTVVFERRGSNFQYLAPGKNLGVRLPDHSAPLTLMQELRRPLACTSANPSGAKPAFSGAQVLRYFGKDVDLILNAGSLPVRPPSTVIDVSGEPFRILRAGAVSRDRLAAVVGDMLEPENG
jgi:5-(carboxyamino)imidazole ribonucleotide mutase